MGIIHRDLKPANVLLDRYGIAHVADFGLVTATHAPSDHDTLVRSPLASVAGLSVAGSVMGTLPYMSPEQLRGQRLDQRADVYGLGATVYHLLVGEPPVKARTAEEALKQIAGRHRPGAPGPRGTFRGPWPPSSTAASQPTPPRASSRTRSSPGRSAAPHRSPRSRRRRSSACSRACWTSCRRWPSSASASRRRPGPPRPGSRVWLALGIGLPPRLARAVADAPAAPDRRRRRRSAGPRRASARCSSGAGSRRCPSPCRSSSHSAGVLASALGVGGAGLGGGGAARRAPRRAPQAHAGGSPHPHPGPGGRPMSWKTPLLLPAARRRSPPPSPGRGRSRRAPDAPGSGSRPRSTPSTAALAGLSGELRFDEASWAEGNGQHPHRPHRLHHRPEPPRRGPPRPVLPGGPLPRGGADHRPPRAAEPGRPRRRAARGRPTRWARSRCTARSSRCASRSRCCSRRRPGIATSGSPASSTCRSPSTASPDPRGSSSSSARWPTSASRRPSGARSRPPATVALAAPGARARPSPGQQPARPAARALGRSSPAAPRSRRPSAAPTGSSPSPRPRAVASGSSVTPAWAASRTRSPAPPATAGATSGPGCSTRSATSRSNSSLWDSARRSTFWRGFADTVEQATDLCVRRFMLRPGGGDATQLADLGAYLRRISPDASRAARLPARSSSTRKTAHRPADRRRRPARRACSPSATAAAATRRARCGPRSRWACTSPTTSWPGSGGSPRTTQSRCPPCRWTGSPTRSSGTSSPTWSGPADARIFQRKRDGRTTDRAGGVQRPAPWRRWAAPN